MSHEDDDEVALGRAAAVAPTKVREDDLHGDQYEHPAYGVIEISRYSQGGPGTRLFGSELNHSNTVGLTIKAGHLTRNLNRDRIHGSEVFIDVQMSEAQWVSLIASGGMGEGTPCTLRYAPKDGYELEARPEIAAPTLRDTFGKEIEDTARRYIADAQAGIAKLKELLDKPSIGKRDLAKIVRDLDITFGNFPSNMGFIKKQLGEAVEDVIASGKAEIEGFARNTLMRAGMEHLTQQVRIGVHDRMPPVAALRDQRAMCVKGGYCESEPPCASPEKCTKAGT